jgi:uncharacterized protein (DUF1684 family)
VRESPQGAGWCLLPGLLLAAAVVLAAAGCESREPGLLLSIEPPAGWAKELGTLRERREDFFRRSPESPLPATGRAGFEGLDYFPPDPAYYFVGRPLVYPRPERFEIATTSGGRRPCERYGVLRFRLDGQVRTLQLYRLLDLPESAPDSFLLPFRDETSGQETYPAGRYVDLDGPPGGPYILDFNAAYNPSCAYGDVERFACPVTPPENRLEVRVEAGERGFTIREGG